MRISDWSSDVCSSDLHAPRGVEIGVEGDGLVLDLLDRVPAPQLPRFLGGAAEMGGVRQRIVRERRGEMFERTGRGELLDRRAALGPGDGPARAIFGRCDVEARILRLAVEHDMRSEEHTSELQSLMRISYAVFCLKKKKTH